MEQRACYRVADHTALRHFELALELPDGQTLPACMLDVCARGLKATTAASDTPLAPGSRLSLRIRCRERGIALRLPALVRAAQLRGDRPCYGLALACPEELSRTLPPDLFSLFNRRRTPRLPVDPRGAGLLRMTGSDRQRARGTLRNLSAAGASLFVPANTDPGFACRQRVCVTGRLGGKPIRLHARVRRTRVLGHGSEYGLEFERDESAYPLARGVLDRFLSRHEPHGSAGRRITERRTAPRACPTSPDGLEVEITTHDARTARGTLRDLSIQGAGILVPALDDLELGEQETAVVRLRLPSEDVEISARIRRVLLIDDNVCYGLEFDAEHTPDFSSQERVLRRFVDVHARQTAYAPFVALGA